LFWRSGAVFAFPDVFHFFAHKLASLSGRRLAFALIFARAFNWFFFWHNKRITPLPMRLDVTNNGSYSIGGVASQLSPVPVAFRADLQVVDPKKFGLAQMPAVKRSRAGICASALTTDEPRICVGRTAIEFPISGTQTPYFRLFV
jgi:hypothetical protein